MALSTERTLEDNYRNLSVEEKSKDKNFADIGVDKKTPTIWNISPGEDNRRDSGQRNGNLDSKLSNIKSPSAPLTDENFPENSKGGIREDLYGVGEKSRLHKSDDMASYSPRKTGCDESIRFSNCDEKFDSLYGNQNGGHRKRAGGSGLRDCCCQEDWVDFTEQTSLHGLRYIWLRDASIIRR